MEKVQPWSFFIRYRPIESVKFILRREDPLLIGLSLCWIRKNGPIEGILPEFERSFPVATLFLSDLVLPLFSNPYKRDARRRFTETGSGSIPSPYR